MAERGDGGSLLVHGTCVAHSGRGALLRGAPGSGKSDLALRFISQFGGDARRTDGARLVSDDQVLLSRDGDTIVARPPGTIAGQLEVRGVGIIEVSHLERVPLVLIVDLADANDIPRLPANPLPCEHILRAPVPVLKLYPFEVSSPVKLKLVLTGRT